MSLNPIIDFLLALSVDLDIREDERSDATRMLRFRLHRFLRDNETNPCVDPAVVDIVRDTLASVEAECLCPTKLFIPDDIEIIDGMASMYHLDAVIDA